jgi:hypothetical protein
MRLDMLWYLVVLALVVKRGLRPLRRPTPRELGNVRSTHTPIGGDTTTTPIPMVPP